MVYLDQPVNLTFMLREVEGIGVTLNHRREEAYNQEGRLIDVIDLKGHDAELIFNGLFGTYDIHGGETLRGTMSFTPSRRGSQRWIFGGIDRLLNTVHGVAEVQIE